MKKIQIVSLIIQICILSSCNQKNNTVDRISLKSEIKINQLTDSTFLTDVRSIGYSNNKIYLTDYKRNQIIILDKNLKFLKSFGTTGKGPGELLGADCLEIINDTIFVVNESKKAIEVFDKFGFIKTIALPTSVQLPLPRFAKINNSFYLSNPSSNKNITVYNPPNIQKTFGQLKQYQTPSETAIKSRKHIVKYKNNIIAISDNQPTIEMYDINGNLLSKFNYGNVDVVSKTIDFINQQPKETDGYYMLISDVNIYSNKLYLIIITNAKKDVKSNKVIEIDIENTNFKISRILDLGKGWFTTFCVTENNLISFDAKNGNLVKFKLKE